MKFSWWPKKKRMTLEQTNIGNVLLKMGAINEGQLEKGVRERIRQENRLIGEIFVKQGAITEDQLKEALELQDQMRNGKKTEAMLRIVSKKTAFHHTRLVVNES